MGRRTVSLPDSIEQVVRENKGSDESFSAAVARLIQAGAAAGGRAKAPRYVASGEGPTDLGRLAERYLREPTKPR